MMRDDAHVYKTAHQAGWRAFLPLLFQSVQGRTNLVRLPHQGPLVVQKPFHPEGDAVCQVVVVHPPGGIAAGDALSLDIEVGPRAHAQLTQPAASKWYRSDGPTASQHVQARVHEHGILEWLPQGAIVFDGARAESTLRLAMAPTSRVIAWELACLGRAAAGERFATGRWRQCIEIVRGDALIWSERANLAGGSALLASPAGLNGAPIFGTFVAASPALDDAALAAAREVMAFRGECAVTRLPDVLVARYRGPASDDGTRYFEDLWSVLRPRLIGRPAVAPRIWST
jgi:urease accessory protein